MSAVQHVTESAAQIRVRQLLGGSHNIHAVATFLVDEGFHLDEAAEGFQANGIDARAVGNQLTLPAYPAVEWPTSIGVSLRRIATSLGV